VFNFNELTELGSLFSQSIGLLPGGEYQLLIIDSVGEGM
jgi:hypothetical protein